MDKKIIIYLGKLLRRVMTLRQHLIWL